MTYAPLVRVKVVQAVPDVFGETEGDIVVSEQNASERQVLQGESFGTQVSQRLFARKSHLWKSIALEVLSHTEAVLRSHELTTLFADAKAC
jgi:hypothetical protein